MGQFHYCSKFLRKRDNSYTKLPIVWFVAQDCRIFLVIYIYRRENGKVILGPAGRALRVRPAGKNVCVRMNVSLCVSGVWYECVSVVYAA